MKDGLTSIVTQVLASVLIIVITINNILFHSCGGYTTDQYRNEYDSYTLFFFNCFAIVIENVVVIDTNGTGILVYHPVKSIYVNNTTFIRNNGSGLIIISPVETIENEELPESFGISTNKLKYHRFDISNSTPLSIMIYESVFTNNTGFNGGGLCISLDEVSVQIVIRDCKFIGNEAFNNGGGGYVRLVSYETRVGQLNFTGCLICNNHAFKGGGLAVILTDTYFVQKHQPMSSFSFENCGLDSNEAQGSAAIHILLESTNNPTNSLFKNFLTFSNCSFKAHTIPLNNQPTIISEYSTITTLRIPLQFINFNIFKYNNATALSIGSTSVILGGVIIFSHNIGMNGGAIAVHDNSYIIISEGLNATFDSNIAINKGPAIYFSNLVPQSGTCFIRYIDISVHPNNWNCSIMFRNNCHGYGLCGSLYISSFNICTFDNLQYSYTLEDILCSMMYDNNTCLKQIFTGPSKINQTGEFLTRSGSFRAMIPIRLYDETGHNISYITPIVYVSHNNHMVESEYSNPNKTYSFTPFINRLMTFADQPNISIKIPFVTTDDQVVGHIIPAKILPCQPGLIFLEKERICVCPTPQPFFLICDVGFMKYSSLAYLKIGWIMTHDEKLDQLYVAPIQLYSVQHYNIFSNNIGYFKLPPTGSEVNQYICGPLNRTGVLCSQCMENTSVAANVYDFPCVPCSGEHLWRNILIYILIQIVPAMIFCIIITVLNINVLSGYMNSFVLFSQILTNPLLVYHLRYQFNVLGTTIGEILLNIAIVPYSMWNLDFFKSLIPPLCLAPEINNLNAWTFQYVNALLPLLLILLMFVFTELHASGWKPVLLCAYPLYKCLRLFRRQWNINTNLISTFTTFFLLSYTKPCAISLFLVVPAKTYILYNTSITSVSKPTLYLEGGQSSYWSREHIPYFSVAVFCLLFFTFGPAIFLILQSCYIFNCCRYRCYQKFIKPFTDNFQGCYKDGTKRNERDCRFFSGIHLLLRFIILLLINIQYGDSIRYLLLPMLMAIIIIVYLHLQPYKLQWANLLEAIFFVILISTIMTFAPLNATFDPLGNSKVLIIFMWVLIMLPLAYMFGFFILWLYRRFKIIEKKRNRWNFKLWNLISNRNTRQVQEDRNWPDRLLEDNIQD